MVIELTSIGILGLTCCVAAVLPLLIWGSTSIRLRQKRAVSFGARQTELRRQIETGRLTSSPTFAKPKSANPICQNQTWHGFRNFTIDHLEKESPTTTSIYLIPTDGKPIAPFSPGQYLTFNLQLTENTKPLVRCYSLSDSPDKSHYRVTVKRVAPPADRPSLPAGRASSYFHEQIQLGQVLAVKAPSGDFVLDESSDRPIIMLAGGIGITPMISIIEHLMARRSQRLMILLYGLANSADHPFRQRLDHLAGIHPHLHLLNCYSRPQPTDRLGIDFHWHGRISVELLQRIIPSAKPDPTDNTNRWRPVDCDYYLCGPPSFMESLYQGLIHSQIDPQRIHFEAFGPASVTVPTSANSHTQPEINTNTDSPPAQIQFTKSDVIAIWNRGSSSLGPSLLELAESNQIEIDSGCRAGSCGACAIRILAGEVDYPAGQPTDCPPEHCLACLARPIPGQRLELEL